VRPREEAGDAVTHCSERFRQMFREAAESVGEVGEELDEAARKLGNWLHERGSGSG
jgi:hypothetical protein